MLKPDEKAKDGCRAPRVGELMWNRSLANTFRLLVRHGKRGFYEGPVADAYVKVVQDRGGHITHEDLKKHADLGSEEVEAISLNFDGQGIGECEDSNMGNSIAELHSFSQIPLSYGSILLTVKVW